ncbi:MAG: short-chain dehydrogenase [Frankiales bacterium]|nr:short-chain dehydrogenase [Frankiales bacterium]
MTDLSAWRGKSVIITGGNSGIGLEAARALRAAGADVVLACRDLARASAVADGMTVRQLDLADLDSVAAFASATTSVDALICNAGIMGGPLLGTVQGHERQMGTNHLGHAALISGLFPLLEAARGRIVIISSIAARGGKLNARIGVDDLVSPPGYLSGPVYANSKQANLLFAQELHRRVGSRVAVVAAHPGVSWTNLFARQLRDEGKAWLVPALQLVRPIVFQTAKAGAQPTLRALNEASGSFVGPKRLNQYRGPAELLEVYTTGSDPAVAARLWEVTEEVLGAPLPA